LEDVVNDNERPLREEVDLDAWEPALPPADFADRVLAKIEAEGAAPPKRSASVVRLRRRAAWGGAAVTTFAVAAAILLGITSPPLEGSAIAKERIEVPLGKRGVAVLEAGASVAWKGDEVTQVNGDVFYRVEPGSRFRVHTPAGDVEVKGTCFAVKVRAGKDDGSEDKDMTTKRDVRSGIVGAGLTALAFVAVYEGKVAVSHASERAELTAGEAAELGPNGVAKSDGLRQGEKAFETNAALAIPGDETFATANQRLAHQVGEYRSRLDAVSAEKADLEKKLKRSEESLAASQGGAAPAKNEYDLSADDWKELAKEGTMKYRTPCMGSKSDPGWSLRPEQLNTLGLSPQDGEAVNAAYSRARDRLWATLKPLCARVVGSAEVADKIGADSCVHLVLDDYKANNPKTDGMSASAVSIKHVGEMRAGLRPLPGANDDVDPASRVFLATTSVMQDFEGDLAQSMGPEEAHRIAWSDELCVSHSTFSTGKPKKK
jgi:hypothetical protein